ncbi:unnamed protein product [Spirodela intermedia]|uniref:Metallo-beta-lactamase domain-containing protein n=2 Tax=Spirodela intermedia TaxID=51605 RepID=A0A7I8IDD0_SPIIN|nr:unnamed protein product [Spirodela intermedia]CAA6655776.1 unnamed protein product [Spirodela intermedia]CAA7391126.1 unnamed protein product [Spirodela intermedia]
MGILFLPRAVFTSLPSPIRGARGRRDASKRGRALAPANATAQRGPRQRRSQNVEGEFFVDERCIDCDACRWMAPDTFARIGEKSAVFNQPGDEEERFRALQALLSCPTGSIGTEKSPVEIRRVQETFPLPIDEQSLPDVRHCGYHSKDSFGATSYLIVHPKGNILVDSPRYAKVLARRIEMLGGARFMFLTHKDDVGDHHAWHEKLGCERILHSADVEASTADVEMQLYGDGPWSLGADFDLIHTPGHSKGSVCLFYKPRKALFTGDHLATSEGSDLNMFEKYNGFSVKLQLSNIRKLLDLDFLWVLPGHGRRVRFRDTKERNSALEAFLAAKEIEHDNSVII